MESNFPVKETNIFGDTPSTSFLPKAQTRSNDSFHTNVEPQRELSWAEMDRFDWYDVCNGKSAIDNNNADCVSKIIDFYLNEVHLDETYASLHRELSRVIIDGRSNDRDCVDGHMDVTDYLHC